MRTRTIEDFAALEALRDAYDDLLARSAAPQVASTPAWLFAWWREFGRDDGRALRVVVVEDESLIGLVPLSTRRIWHRRAIPIRRLELLGRGEDPAAEVCSDYLGPIAARGRERDVASAFAQALTDGALGRWDELAMPAMSGDDPSLAHLRAQLAAHGAHVAVEQTDTSFHIPLPPTWDDYLKALKGQDRYVVTRALRELAAWAGPDGYAVTRATTRAELEEGKRVLRSLHSERWSADGRDGVFANARFRRFHDDVMADLFAGRDGASLDLAWLSVKGEPVAATYSLVFANAISFYQSGRKLDVPKNVRVGIAMHALAIQAAIAARRAVYDFLGGDAQYKRQLSLATRPIVTLRAVAPTARARVLDVARGLSERAAAAVRERRR